MGSIICHIGQDVSVQDWNRIHLVVFTCFVYSLHSFAHNWINIWGNTHSYIQFVYQGTINISVSLQISVLSLFLSI